MNCLIDPQPTTADLQLFHRIYSKAVQLLQRDGNLQPVAFFRIGQHPQQPDFPLGQVVPVKIDMPGHDQGKDAVAQALRHVVKLVDADLVLMVLESWMVKPSPEEAEHIQKTGTWSVRPSLHPQRIEIVFFSMSKPDGSHWSAWVEIRRDTQNKPSIPADPPKLEYLKSGGRFGNLFENESKGGDTDGPASTSFAS